MQVVQLLDHQLEILRQLPNVVRYNVISGQELCIVGDLHGQFEVRASGLLLSHCYTLLRAATHALPPRALRMRVSATTGP